VILPLIHWCRLPCDSDSPIEQKNVPELRRRRESSVFRCLPVPEDSPPHAAYVIDAPSSQGNSFRSRQAFPPLENASPSTTPLPGFREDAGLVPIKPSHFW